MSKKINFRASEDIILFQFMRKYIHQNADNEFYYDGTLIRDINPGVMVDFSIEHTYEVFNILGNDWGGRNACSTSDEMYAVAKKWEEKYTAELIDIGHDSLNFKINRKLKAKEIDSLIEDIKAINAEPNHTGEFEGLRKSVEKDLQFFLWWD